jgi:Ras-related GTP-binding protein A/B
MENYFTSQKHNIFRNVAVLIYVFDVDTRQLEKDLQYYTSCLASIREVRWATPPHRHRHQRPCTVPATDPTPLLQNSMDAKIFCLVHKMDLVPEDQRDIVSKLLWPAGARPARAPAL